MLGPIVIVPVKTHAVNKMGHINGHKEDATLWSYKELEGSINIVYYCVGINY